MDTDAFADAWSQAIETLGTVGWMVLGVFLVLLYPLIVGWIAASKGRSGWGWFFSTAAYTIFSSVVGLPLIGLAVSFLALKIEGTSEYHEDVRKTYVYAGYILVVLLYFAPLVCILFFVRRLEHVTQTDLARMKAQMARQLRQGQNPPSRPVRRDPPRRRSATARKFKRR